MPPPATCDPSNFLTPGMSMSTPSGPGPATWMGPVPADGGPPPTVSNIYTTVGITDPNATTFSYATDVAAPYADAAGCKMFDAQGHPAAHNCLCDKCFSLMQQCDALTGCRTITKCGWDTGCDVNAALTSLTSCYPLFGGAGCKAPIDKYGTGSVSTALSQQLGKCGSTNGCPAQ
jgi:hypothetical protein